MTAQREGMLVKSGIVKWFNPHKGYGVIMPFDGGFNVYVNITAVERAGLAELKEGQRVNFNKVLDTLTGKIFAENLSIPLDRQEPVPSVKTTSAADYAVLTSRRAA